jgi:hypothetical protein
MLNGSKQKRIYDWNMVRDLLEKPFNPALQTAMLTEESREFHEAYKADSIVDMVDAYCDFIFVLRGAQASLIATDFAEDYGSYITALNLVNGATNQGFMLLELLTKVCPIGPRDIDECFNYVIDANEAKPKDAKSGKIIKGDDWVDPKFRIKMLIHGNCEQ